MVEEEEKEEEATRLLYDVANMKINEENYNRVFMLKFISTNREQERNCQKCKIFFSKYNNLSFCRQLRRLMTSTPLHKLVYPNV